MLLIDLIQSEDYSFWRNTPVVYDLSVDLDYNLDSRIKDKIVEISI